MRYVGDWQPGFSRKLNKKRFVYLNLQGQPLRDRVDLSRIKALAIPPAWTGVWICSKTNGHLQATGRDARGRKQYRYHARWREIRDENKYQRMIAFAQALPAIRASVQRDLTLFGLPRAKVLATIVKLLESTHIRVGNEEYARSNKSFGLATLRNRHVKVNGRNIRFQFRGKSRVAHAIDLQDKRLARIIKRCQDLPGYELFQYVDETGATVAIEAGDVNEYLREIAGTEFSTKDFRTWAGTLVAAHALRACAACDSKTQIKRNIVQAVEKVARALGNTKAVCRKCYIHPAVIEAYSSGALRPRFARAPRCCSIRFGPRRSGARRTFRAAGASIQRKSKTLAQAKHQRQNQTPFKDICRSCSCAKGAKLRGIRRTLKSKLVFGLLQNRHASIAGILILGRSGMARNLFLTKKEQI